MGKSLYVLQHLFGLCVIRCMIMYDLYKRALNVLERDTYYQPYLDSNTSKKVDNTKDFERTIIKELGKMTPLVRDMVCHYS